MNLDYHTAALYLYMYHKVERHYPQCFKQYLASLSPDQVRCKEELVTNLYRLLSSHRSLSEPVLDIHVVGCWFSMPLVDMLFKTLGHRGIGHIDLFDIDVNAARISNTAIRKWGHDEVCTVHLRDYWYNDPQWPNSETAPNLVINTSTEHMMQTLDDGLRDYDSNVIFALQSNNKRHIAEHVNCVDSPEELADNNGIDVDNPSIVLSTTVLDGGYERYTVIGKRRS